MRAGAGYAPAVTELAEADRFFHDWTRLTELSRLVGRCQPLRPPCVQLLQRDPLQQARRVAILSGSFNPLTGAHVALADAAERSGFEPVVFLLSTLTVDKERLEGARLEDRLLVLELHARHRPGRAVALINRGLYFEQAGLLRTVLPSVDELTFVVGFDKIVQILDPRYYDDREIALAALFDLASFAVAPRESADRAALAALLRRPENRPYAERVQYLPLPAELRKVASSRARAELAEGGPVPTELAPEARAFVLATGCYGPPRPGPDGRPVEPYLERAARIARLDERPDRAW